MCVSCGNSLLGDCWRSRAAGMHVYNSKPRGFSSLRKMTLHMTAATFATHQASRSNARLALPAGTVHFPQHLALPRSQCHASRPVMHVSRRTCWQCRFPSLSRQRIGSATSEPLEQLKASLQNKLAAATAALLQPAATHRSGCMSASLSPGHRCSCADNRASCDQSPLAVARSCRFLLAAGSDGRCLYSAVTCCELCSRHCTSEAACQLAVSHQCCKGAGALEQPQLSPRKRGWARRRLSAPLARAGALAPAHCLARLRSAVAAAAGSSELGAATCTHHQQSSSCWAA